VPVALFATAGIVADRHFAVPVPFSLLTAAGSLVTWLVLRRSSRGGLPLVYLWIASAGLAAAYHHGYREGFSADDISRFATAEARPARLRGVIVEEPTISWQVHGDPLQSMDRSDSMVAVFEATQLNLGQEWASVSGRARLILTSPVPGLHVGDEIEVVGRLTTPNGPANPGELDYASFLKDRRIGAVVAVRKTPEGVTVLAEKWPRSLGGWLGFAHSWAQGVLERNLPPKTSGIATALLLGGGSTMTPDSEGKAHMTHEDWDKYIRTGVIHVLAISGQHLIILAGFLWAALRLLRVRRRRGALGVALFLLAYCLLTGGRPPAMRAAVAVGIYCGGMLLRRPPLTANSFALGWLVVAALKPTDLFDAGCQLSFLAVALLYWGTSRWIRVEQDPLDRLIEENQPVWYRMVRRLVRKVGWIYLATVVIWLAVSPLVASHYHLVAPIGILIGPPVILLGAVALLAGFCLLLGAAIGGPLVGLCALVTHWSLTGCEMIVDGADGWPLSHWYVSDIPTWWLWFFYVGLLGFVMLETFHRRARWVALAGLGWLCVGMASGWSRPASNELCCTFLAVGHGGCTVLETPDGRVLLYDAGALGGPDVTRRQIAPFLWSRNIRRIDEVFLSHADLDHFNGLPGLLDRFAVGQVSCTPSFAEKPAPGVPITLDAIRRRGVPIRILKAGDRLSAGSVTMEVLHPPLDGPPGKENFRSLVLVVQHGDHRIMLTGDLEGPGLERVLALTPPSVDVLMAPHHGSRAGDAREKDNRTRLAVLTWPNVIVSCQGLPRGSPNKPDPYSVSGARFLGTWPHGAITIRSQRDTLTVETFQTGQAFTLSRR
jgi:competence protein ComEC